MACVRGAFVIVVLCLSAFCVSSEEPENEIERGMNMLFKTYQHCEATGALVPCLKLKAVKFADRALKISSIPLFEGITVVRNDREVGGRGFSDMDFEENTLPENPDRRDDVLDTVLVDRITRFLKTHSLQFSLPRILDSRPGEITAEGRGKYKKYMGPLIIAAMMKGGMFAYAMKAVGILAAKALLVSKVALVLASVIGLKKLFSSGGAESKTIEIVQKPQISHSHAYSGGDFGGLGQAWEPSGHGSSGSGGYSRRAFDTTDPSEEAQSLAFRGRRH